MGVKSLYPRGYRLFDGGSRLLQVPDEMRYEFERAQPLRRWQSSVTLLRLKRPRLAKRKAVSRTGNPRSGAAKTAPVTKCMRTYCEANAVVATGKPLSGAAPTSFLKKCKAGGEAKDSLDVGAIVKQMIIRSTFLLALVLISTTVVAQQMPEPGAPTQSSGTVRSIQGELGRLGYYAGPINGRVDPTTQAAIGHYQHDKGLPVDGQASSRLWSFMQSNSGRTDRDATTLDQAHQSQNGTHCCR